MKAKGFWILVLCAVLLGCCGLMGAVIGEDSMRHDRQVDEMNKQLKRIADSLEIISGQRNGWKLPK